MSNSNFSLFSTTFWFSSYNFASWIIKSTEWSTILSVELKQAKLILTDPSNVNDLFPKFGPMYGFILISYKYGDKFPGNL